MNDSVSSFRVLADAISGAHSGGSDASLGVFYRQLAQAEGRHWEMFRDLAVELVGSSRAHRRVEEVAAIEGEIISSLPVEPRMH